MDSDDALAQLRVRLSAGGVADSELPQLFGTADLATTHALIAKSLVRALQQSRGLDTVFIVASMLMLKPPQANQHLSVAIGSTGLHSSRVIAMANIGAICNRIWYEPAVLDRCLVVAAAARWSEQLRLLNICFDPSHLADPKPGLLDPLVRPLLMNTAMDISAALEFADAFHLDRISVILEYIALCCSAPHIDGYQARILGIVDDSINAKLLERTYIDCLENAISAYDYDRLHFVVHRIQELRPQDANIAKYSDVLDVLCSYDRQEKPSHDELMLEWSRTRSARDAFRQAGCDAQDKKAEKKREEEEEEEEEEKKEKDGFLVRDLAKDADLVAYEKLVAEYPLALKRLPFHSL
ncbi:hypothetical protein GGF37_006956, partial [Kickxella alabastrina]